MLNAAYMYYAQIMISCSSNSSNEYLCFQKIIKSEFTVPDAFQDTPRDLVTKLLVSCLPKFLYNVYNSSSLLLLSGI